MDVSLLDDFAFNLSSTATEIAHDAKDSLQKSINIEHLVNSFSYSEFKGMISNANALVKNLYEKDGFIICFEYAPTHYLNLFWRLTTVVNCTITRSPDMTVVSQRVLTLRRFFVLYQEIKRVSQLPTTSSNGPVKPISDETCLLCYDECPSSILPCGHNFCRKCIDAWFKTSFKLPSERSTFFSPRYRQNVPQLRNRQQCPLCRGPCTRNTEAWDLLDIPDAWECWQEMASVLLNLIFNAGWPLNPDSPK